MLDRAYPTRSRRAIALSIATHIAVLAILTATVTGNGRFATGFSAAPIHVAIMSLTRHRAVQPVRPVVVRQPVSEPTAAPAARALREQAVHRKTNATVPERTKRGRASVERVPGVQSLKLASTAVAPDQPDERVTVQIPPQEQPTALPSAAPQNSAPNPGTGATGTANAGTGGSGSIPGSFGQNQPATFYQQATAGNVRARLGPRDLVRIRVDETGRATEVEFVRFSGTDSARSDLRDVLLAMRYLPAENDGMRSEGTIELHV
jgi:hypothetical protein